MNLRFPEKRNTVRSFLSQHHTQISANGINSICKKNKKFLLMKIKYYAVAAREISDGTRWFSLAKIVRRWFI